MIGSIIFNTDVIISCPVTDSTFFVSNSYKFMINMTDQQQDEQPQNDSISKLQVPPQVRRKKMICLFGLSADPPTGYGGHVGIVQTLQQQNQWDEIWVMPVYRHTYKVRI